VLKISGIYRASRISRLICAGKELAYILAVMAETRINILESYGLGGDMPLRGQGLPQG
jgi:hypothetical protein